MGMEDMQLDIRLITLREIPERCRVHHWDMMRYGGTPVEVHLSTDFRANKEAHMLTLTLGVHYSTLRSQISRPLMDYELEADFEILAAEEVAAIERGDLLVPTDLLALMLSIGIGAARGMIALRAGNTFLRHYPLPIYDIPTLINNILAVGEDLAG